MLRYVSFLSSHLFVLFRARTEQYGGAWCPLNQITSMPNEYLEIDFGNLTYLTQVETQGRFDNGRGKEFAEHYILMYTRSARVHHEHTEDDVDDDDRQDLTSWIEYKPKIFVNDEINSSWIRANQNTYMGEIRQLSTTMFVCNEHVTRAFSMVFQILLSLLDDFVSFLSVNKRVRFACVSKCKNSISTIFPQRTYVSLV
jgi:hypothetical protein